MMDLKNGILDVHGFLLTKDTKLSDFYGLPAEDVKIKTTERGNTYIDFIRPLHSNGIDVAVEIYFFKGSTSPKIVLWPAVPPEVGTDYDEITKYKVEASKKWLKGLIDTEPTVSTSSSVYYEFEGVEYLSLARKDRHYGLVGGEIEMTFHEAQSQ